MTRNLKSRVERLEAKNAFRSGMPLKWHRIIQDLGESEVAARARYERETGRTIGAGDGVVLRIIVGAVEGRPASLE